MGAGSSIRTNRMERHRLRREMERRLAALKIHVLSKSHQTDPSENLTWTLKNHWCSSAALQQSVREPGARHRPQKVRSFRSVLLLPKTAPRISERKKERERESKAAITTSNKKLRTLEAIAPRVSRPLLVAADGRFRKGGGTRGRVRKGRPGPTSGGPRGAEFHRGTRDEEDLART